MKPMAQAGRVSAICGGACAAIAGLTAISHNHASHSSFSAAALGFFVGLIGAVSIGLFIKSRTAPESN